jgi:signal peptidase II
MKKCGLYFAAGVFLIFLDQLSKYLVRSNILPGERLGLVGNFLYLTFVHNTGAVFGSLKGSSNILIWITLIVLGLIIFLWDKLPKNGLSMICLTMIISGSIGNMIDRIFLGYVTDFIDVGFWPVFNLADSLVTVGSIGLAISMIVVEFKLGQKTKKK